MKIRLFCLSTNRLLVRATNNLTEYQQEFLKQTFEKQNLWTREDQQLIAKQLGISTTKVIEWYQKKVFRGKFKSGE